ncbi:conserved exported hypothetical protein [Desulfovibrionales bacterium]
MTRSIMGPCLALCLTILNSGCASVKAIDHSQNSAASTWEAFRTTYIAEQSSPKSFSCTATLNYSSPKGSNRVVARLWGNLNRLTTAVAVRLDLQTSIGAAISHCREDQKAFTIYLPTKQMAYLHHDGQAGMAVLGVPLPFSLIELARLITGDWRNLAPAGYTSARSITMDGQPAFEYIVSRPEDAINWKYRRNTSFIITLDPSGQPLALTEPGLYPWHITFNGMLENSGPLRLPKKITMSRKVGEQKDGKTDQVVLFLKTLERRNKSWPEISLTLPLPSGTQVHMLQN